MKWYNVEKLKDVLCDKNLSLGAKGLFVIIERFIPYFLNFKKEIQGYCRNEEIDIYSALLELVANGYIPKEYLDNFYEEK